MAHIHSMTKLREAVAFEWYAQKNPLVVYKEKAYEKFTILMGEIEYKTTKAMYSITPQTRVVVEDPDLSQVEVENMVQELEWMIDGQNWAAAASKKSSWANPIFSNPNQAPKAKPEVIRVMPPGVKQKKSASGWEEQKTKIRV